MLKEFLFQVQILQIKTSVLEIYLVFHKIHESLSICIFSFLIVLVKQVSNVFFLNLKLRGYFRQVQFLFYPKENHNYMDLYTLHQSCLFYFLFFLFLFFWFSSLAFKKNRRAKHLLNFLLFIARCFINLLFTLLFIVFTLI